MLSLEQAVYVCMAQQKGRGRPRRSGSHRPCLDTIWPRDAQGTQQAGAQQGFCSASDPLDRGKHSVMGRELAGRDLARGLLRVLPAQVVWIPVLHGDGIAGSQSPPCLLKAAL